MTLIMKGLHLEFEKAIIEDLSWMNFKWDSLEKQSTRLEALR